MEGEAPPPGPPGSAGEISWISDEPERIRLSANVRRPALLVLSDQAYPGWRCLVDGARVPTRTVNAFMRGAFIAVGQHEIEWRFQPRILTLSAWISAAGLGLCLLTGFALRRRKGQERLIE